MTGHVLLDELIASWSSQETYEAAVHQFTNVKENMRCHVAYTVARVSLRSTVYSRNFRLRLSLNSVIPQMKDGVGTVGAIYCL